MKTVDDYKCETQIDVLNWPDEMMTDMRSVDNVPRDLDLMQCSASENPTMFHNIH